MLHDGTQKASSPCSMMANRRQATTAIFTFSDDEKLTGAAIEDVAAKNILERVF